MFKNVLLIVISINLWSYAVPTRVLAAAEDEEEIESELGDAEAAPGDEELDGSDADFEDGSDMSFDEFDEKGKESKKEKMQAAPTPEPDVQPKEEFKAEEEPILPPQEPEPQPQQAEIDSAPEVNDEPDIAFENKLHDLYINFYSKKMSKEEWSTLLTDRKAENYQIQDRDSLWAISKTLFGDGNYWPKVWSLNGNIENPHLISQGNTIKFILGDESEPPAFLIAENEEIKDIEAPDPNDKPEEKLEELDVDIPPPSIQTRPVIKRIPPSLPEWQSSRRNGNYDDYGIDYARRKILDVKDTIPVSDYVIEDEIQPIGHIEEMESGGHQASLFEYIYVRFKKDAPAHVGEKYIVQANQGLLQSNNSEILVGRVFAVQVQGEIELIEQIKSDKANRAGGEMFRALITRSINPITLEGELTRGQISTITLDESGPVKQISAQIIGGQFDNKRQVLGPQTIVYLNRGGNEGLAAGDILDVRANRRIRNPATLIRQNVNIIGKIRVISVTPRYATAVIVKSLESIFAGDLTGAGEFMERTKAAQNIVEPKAEEKAVDEPTVEESTDEDMDIDDSEIE